MLFNSYVFIGIFLPIVLIGFYILNNRFRSSALIWLSLSSVVFYAYWNVYALPVLLLSVLFNYSIGQRLLSKGAGASSILSAAILVNFFVLGYFKYTNFILENLNIVMSALAFSPFELIDVELPIGISFFTFTQIVYLIDVYQGKTRESSFRNYFLFVTFFPQLIAGPFLHHKTFLPQVASNGQNGFGYGGFFLGMFIFSVGLAKKILIADPLGVYADGLFDSVFTNGLEPMLFSSWFGSLAYTFQIYFDFSGYSDMALGLGLLFGIKLPINFNSPYKATSIIDFWQRWHMTLTGYIGQYLFTPITLWFMRKSYGRNSLVSWCGSIFFPNIMVFFIVGVWHGASWTFIIWGLIHGVFLVMNHAWRSAGFGKVLPDAGIYPRLKTVVSWALTFVSVNFAFVMFRSQDLGVAKQIYSGLIGLNGVSLPPSLESKFGMDSQLTHWLQIETGSSLGYIISLVLAFLIVMIPSNAARLVGLLSPGRELELNKFLYSNFSRIAFVGFIFGLSLIGLNRVQTFLYFQF